MTNRAPAPVTYLFGSSKLPPEPTNVSVFQSTRMADPDVEDDVMYGKRFSDPKTGRAASIVDILMGQGVIGPEER